MVTLSIQPPRRQKRAYRMIEFVRPDSGRYSFYPYSLEESFHVMRAALADGRGVFSRTPWGKRSLADVLYGRGVVNSSYSASVSSLHGLDSLFQRLLLGRADDEIQAWRQTSGFNVTGQVALSFNTYKPMKGVPAGDGEMVCEAEFGKAVKDFLEGYSGKILPVSLNYIHLKARTIVGTSITISPDGFRFILRYGLDGSIWDECLAFTMNGEPFSHTFSRAYMAIKGLMDDHDGPEAFARRLNRLEPISAYPSDLERFVNLNGTVVSFPLQIGNQYQFFGYFGPLGPRSPRYCVVFDHTKNDTVMVATDSKYDFDRLLKVVGMLNDNAVPSDAARGYLELNSLGAA